MNNNLKLLGLCCGLAVIGALPAQAQDKATLDLLVKKGVITQEDADSIAKGPVLVTAHDTNVKKLTFEGDLQIQYDWLTTDDKGAGAPNPTATSEFMIRRAHLGAIADFGNGWGGEVLLDFAAGAQPPSVPQAAVGDAWNLFEKAVITDKTDYGLMSVGYQKVMFGLEETTSANAVKPIERSLGSRYFDEAYKGNTTQRIGFANHHVGIFWDGKLDSVPGLTYGAALTNGVQSSEQYSNAGGLNKFGGWLYGAYAGKVGDLSYKTGLNFGYTPEGNSLTATTQSNSVYGYNPYVTLDYGNFELSSEFEQAMVTNGRVNGTGVTSRADPYAYAFTPSYKLTKEWEIVARYSVLFTDGRGTNISDVVRDGENVISTPATTKFNDADQFYAGLNWYIMGNSVKWSVGYEYTEFNNRGSNTSNFNGAKANVGGVRTRMQITF